MTLILSEREVSGLVQMADALRLVESAFLELGSGRGENLPRRRIRVERSFFHNMGASYPPTNNIGLKAYVSGRGPVRFLVGLWDLETADLQALMGGDTMGQTRTGAASGVATKFLAAPDASILGVIGTGHQAVTQVQAVCAVRPIKEIRAFGRDADRRAKFCQDITALTGVEARPSDSAEAAVRGAQVVITITSSSQPVLLGEWLEPGMHINAAGSNMLARKELDVAAIARADRVFVDQLATAQGEAGDLAAAVEDGAWSWDSAIELGGVIAGTVPGRESADQITLFESQGLAIQDIAMASHIYDLAKQQGLGQEIDII